MSDQPTETDETEVVQPHPSGEQPNPSEAAATAAEQGDEQPGAVQRETKGKAKAKSKSDG